MDDGVTSEVSLGSAAVREETEKQAPSENRGLIVFLGVIAVLIVGLSVGIVLVNARRGVDNASEISDVVDDGTETVVPGSVPTEDVVIKDKMEGWDGSITASTQASMFSKEVDRKLDDITLDYSLERAQKDYQDALNESEGRLKLELSLVYARFIYERLGDIEFATQILDDVSEVAMESIYNMRSYYYTLYDLYNKAGYEDAAAVYKSEYERIKESN